MCGTAGRPSKRGWSNRSISASTRRRSVRIQSLRTAEPNRSGWKRSSSTSAAPVARFQQPLSISGSSDVLHAHVGRQSIAHIALLRPSKWQPSSEVVAGNALEISWRATRIRHAGNALYALNATSRPLTRPDRSKRGVNGGQANLKMIKSLVKLPRLDSNQQPFG